MVGYTTLNEPVNIRDTVIQLGGLILKAGTRALQTVTITAQTPAVDRQLDKTVINVSRNPAAAGTNVLELLGKLPGVKVTPDGQITLEGRSNVNVLVDGKPTYMSAADLSALLAAMPSANVQQIEVMTNPSAKFDAAGNAGIINVIRRRSRQDGFSGSVNAGLRQGFYGGYNGGLTLGYQNSTYNLYLGNGYTYYKGYNSGTLTADILNTDNSLNTRLSSFTHAEGSVRAYTPALALDVYLSKRTTLNLTGNAALRTSDHETWSAVDSYDGSLAETGHEDFNAINHDQPFNYTVGLGLTHKLDTAGRQLSVDLDLSCDRNRPRESDLSSFNDAAGNFLSASDVLLEQARTLSIYAGKADYTQPFTGGKLEAGLKSSYVKAHNDNDYYNGLGGMLTIDPSQSSHIVNSENINAAYISLNRAYGPLSLQTGLRGEQTVTRVDPGVYQNYFQLFPTLFLADKLSDDNTLNFKFGKRVDRPDYHELVPFRVPQTATLFFQGNPALKPQLTWHAELTYGWRQTFFINAGYDIDRNYIRTFPYLDSDKMTATRIPTNVQGARTWNVDLTFTKKPLPWWSADYTLSVYQNSFTGSVNGGFSLDNGGIPSIDLSGNNNFTIDKNWNAEADFEYESKRQYVSSTYGAYAVLNLALKHLVLKGSGSLTLNFDDVFRSAGRYSIDHYQYLNQYGHGKVYDQQVRLTFNYRFGGLSTNKPRMTSGSAEEQGRAGN